MADSKPTDVHTITKYLVLDIWYMQNTKIMWFNIRKASMFETIVNWSQTGTRESFQKDRSHVIKKDLTNKTQRLYWTEKLFEILVSKNVLRPKCNCTVNDSTPHP